MATESATFRTNCPAANSSASQSPGRWRPGNPVLLADEPTGELDFRTGAQILELLIEQATGDRAVLVVTHNREISRIADRVVEMSSGRIVSDGPPEGGKTPLSELRW